LHKSWQNQFWISLIIGGLLSLPAFAKNKSYPPGIYGSLKKLIDLDNFAYTKTNKVLLRNAKTLSDLKNAKEVKLDPIFQNSLYLHTPSKYMGLATGNDCLFYNIMNTDLVRTAEGPVNNVYINYKNENNQRVSAIVSKETYLKKVVPGRCNEVIRSRALFKTKRMKRTFKEIIEPMFNTTAQCLEYHQNFRTDAKSPYFCDIYEKIKNLTLMKTQLLRMSKKNRKARRDLRNQIAYASKLRKNVTVKQNGIIGMLCENIHNPDRYCKEVFSSSYWDKAALGERDRNNIRYYCKDLKNKNKPSRTDFISCAKDMNRSPELCTYINKSVPSLFPKPPCDIISKALNHSRFYAGYKDCPGRMGNLAVANVGRIARHFKKDPGEDKNLCHSDTAHAFAALNFNVDNDNAWGLNFCYFDKIADQEVCKPVVIGNIKDSELDAGKNVAKILNRLKGTAIDQKCEVVTSNQYNPAILKYKTGCFITTDPLCMATDCLVQFKNQEQDISDIKANFNFSIDYFMKDINTAQFAQNNVIAQSLKKRKKEMLNTTFIKKILSENSDSIIHGVGCAEDILPHFFKKRSFNQCRPLPFIIDGFIENDGRFTFVVRTALDDIHAPRLINWSYLYNGLKSYQTVQPLGRWGLSAIY
jgi:hypothetical protein